MELHASPKRLTVRDQLVLSIFWFSLNIQKAALFPIVIPLQILLFATPGQVGNAQQALLLGWISTVGAVVSLIMPPVFGMLSDNTRGSWGRRRPYIAAGAVLLVLSALLLAVAGRIAIFVLALMINQVGSNAANATYQALLPDLVPKEQRGEASGYMGLMTIIGSIGSLAALLLGQVSTTVVPMCEQQDDACSDSDERSPDGCGGKRTSRDGRDERAEVFPAGKRRVGEFRVH